MLVFPALALAQLAAFGLPGAIPASVSQILPSVGGCADIPVLMAIPVASPILAAAVTTPATTLHTLLDHFDETTAASTVDRREWGNSIHDDPGDLHRVYYQNVDGISNTDDTKSCVHLVWLNSRSALSVGPTIVLTYIRYLYQ